MYLENARALVQGILLLSFVALAVFVDHTVGLLLITAMGLLRLQQAVTDTCLPDPFLRRMGLKKRWETVGREDGRAC